MISASLGNTLFAVFPCLVILSGAKDPLHVATSLSRRTYDRTYSVYILTNRYNGTLYVGVSGILERRIWEHKTGAREGFTKQYGLDRLVYFEPFRDVRNAIAREKEIKGWVRRRKIALIESTNPNWDDLSADWFDQEWVLRCAQDDKQ